MDLSVSEFRPRLEAWKERTPAAVRQVDAKIHTTLGERHGTWLIEFSWWSGGLHRAAGVGVTNATALSDTDATEAIISVRASASSETHWTATSIYEKRRALGRVSTDSLETWLESAVRIAATFTPGGLTESYVLPIQEIQRG